MPFADYENFEACVRENSDKRDSEAYCAVIKRQTEGKLDYSQEELLTLKTTLDLNQTEFMKALTLLEEYGDVEAKLEPDEISVGDWVEWTFDGATVVGKVTGGAKEERSASGNKRTGEEGVADVFELEEWDDQTGSMGARVVKPASDLRESEEPEDFRSKAEIPEKYLGTRDESFFVPNDTVAEEAQQALDWKEEHPDETEGGGTDGEGWRRAQQLVDYNSDNEPLAIEFWQEIDAFHSRHHAQGNHELDEEVDNEWEDAGYVSHLTWGGDAGYSQAQSVVEVVEDVDG